MNEVFERMKKMSLSIQGKWIAIAIGLLLIVLGVFLFRNDNQQAELIFPNEMEENKIETDEEREVNVVVDLVIDVKGAVQEPGVYTMNEGDRVIDVIEKAGGFQSEADENLINLAELLKDEMVIYVPKKGEDVTALQSVATHVAGENEDKVRINSASPEEIQTLQGIGPAKATSIIKHREENGKFNSVEDLLEVSGIGEKTLENIKDHIVID